MGSINHPVVGAVAFTALSGGRIDLHGWDKTHIRAAAVPQLRGVPTYGGNKFSGQVPFYGPAIPQLVAAWAAVEDAGLLHRVIFWGGSFVPRMKRGSSTSPSEHTFGCAFDINPEQNPFRTRPAQPGQKGYLLDLCPIFERFGFECGAKWRQPDGMHFQIKHLLTELQVSRLTRSVQTPPIVAPKPQPAAATRAYFLNKTQLKDAREIDGRLMAPVREVTTALGFELDAEDLHNLRAFHKVQA